MADSELLTLRSEVESLRMALFQLQGGGGAAGGGAMEANFMPIGDFKEGGGVAEMKWKDPDSGYFDREE